MSTFSLGIGIVYSLQVMKMVINIVSNYLTILGILTFVMYQLPLHRMVNIIFSNYGKNQNRVSGILRFLLPFILNRANDVMLYSPNFNSPLKEGEFMKPN